jgi:hypothetical protein
MQAFRSPEMFCDPLLDILPKVLRNIEVGIESHGSIYSIAESFNGKEEDLAQAESARLAADKNLEQHLIR